MFSVPCSIKIDETTIITTGGQTNDYRASTRIYDFETKQWTAGPKMKTGRREHGCAKFEYQGRTILIVAGGRNDDGELRSVEFLDLDNGSEWIEGMILLFR